MGGTGSGTWSRYESKLKTDAVPAIDIRQLQLDHQLIPGRKHIKTWRRCGVVAAQVVIEVQQQHLLLRYVRISSLGQPESVQCVVPFTSTPCHYGGVRRWLLCPDCKKRIAVIYVLSKGCACRHCHDLVYSSQRERAGDRARQRAQNIRVRLGGSANLFERFPGKPKCMRWATYQRLQLEAIKQEGVNLANLNSMLERRWRPVI